MKRFNRIISTILLLCMVISMLPPIQFARAAEVVRRYELDTDGIDVGATYLIVNTGSAGNGNALRFYYAGNTRDFKNQTLSVQTDEAGIRYIASGFTNEENCQFQFSATTAGSITHGDYAVNLSNSNFTSGNPSNTLTFTNAGNGAYRIHYTSWWTTYYLRYNNSDWARSNTNSTVYLYKLVEYEVGYNVSFDGNGYTAGTLPEDALSLDSGSTYTLPAPSADLRKDIGEDTWLFLCWNTKADGSGTEYLPGETITITEDITLYADWYPQTKYVVTMITDLDGERTDVKDISGQDKVFFVQLEGGDGTYLPLHKTATGTYSAKVVDNGTYIVYSQTNGGAYEAVHGHQVVIYNQDGQTECQHFSVSYNTAGGVWTEEDDPGALKYHALENVTLTDKIPTLEGNRFLGWLDQDGNLLAPGAQIAAISEKVTLTAQWEQTVSVSVDVNIDHMPATGGVDTSETKDDLTFHVMRTDENGYNHLVGTITLTEDAHGKYTYTYDEENHTTIYSLPAGQVTLADLQKGVYTVAVSKSHYDAVVATETDSDGNTTIRITLQYVPTSFDLNFDVVVKDWDSIPEALRPQAVNIKVNCWGYDDDGNLGWRTITQQDGANPPTTVTIDPATGKGTGLFPVWQYWSTDDGINHPYVYRIRVSSYVMPDGTIEPATEKDLIYYTAGIYNGTVTIEPAGSEPDYPDGSGELTDLTGTKYDPATNSQDSIPTLTVAVTPFTVTFDAQDGLLNGQQRVVLQEQYRYPDLRQYQPVPNAADKLFVCWCDENGDPVTDLAGQLLSGNITLTARYNENIALIGNVSVDAVFEQNGQTVVVPEIDRPTEIVVVLQKQVGELYIDMASQKVPVTYDEAANTCNGTYAFAAIPNDGTQYRVHALTINYAAKYDNDQDSSFSSAEDHVIIDPLSTEAQVDIHLDFEPYNYQQAVKVDATQIAEGMRPTGALVQLLYRDLGDVHHYQVISHHTVDPFGIPVSLDKTATGIGFEDVWSRHTDGTLYEYQAQVAKMYGVGVEGVFTEEGIPYSASSPYTIVYGAPNNFFRQEMEGGVMLTATLVPKQYPITLDLNLGDDTATPVLGMEHFLSDSSNGEQYTYTHTWSFADKFDAFPYRDGYVFTGWTCSEDDDVVIDNGTIHIGATLDHPVTLTAQWDKLTGTDYSIRYLELNTDEVLHGAQTIRGAVAGDIVVAADKVLNITGYEYAGAMVGGEYYEKDTNPSMTVTNDPLQNLMVIYYLPDESSGYTEQVEGNMSANKTAILEDNGTYTITLDTYTTDNPITTRIQQDTPLDIVLVLDQSGSLAANDFAYLTELQNAVTSFVESVADHGRRHEVDHRIAMVGYAGNETDAHSGDPVKATGGKETDTWINTGVFDSNGEFHLYNVNGFTYSELTDISTINAGGTYYTKVTVDGQDKYLLLRHHDEYRHLIDEEQARIAILRGETVYGYVYNEQDVGTFVELTRNSSGLWLYGNKQLYSLPEFFTYHTDVWTHRDGLNPRQIHAYGVGENYQPTDGHEGVYIRTETTGDDFEQSIYVDALVPVSLGANGSGGTAPGLLTAIESFGADGATRASYGMEMANEILKATPVDPSEGRIRLVLMFTDGEPGYLGFDSSSGDEYYQQAVTEANNAIAQSYITKNTHDAYVYTIGLYKSAGVSATSEVAYYMNALSSNYPNAQSMDDIKGATKYVQAANGTALENDGTFYVLHNNSGSTYYEVKYGYVRVSGSYYSQYRWYYTRNNTNYSISTTTNPTVSNGKVGNFTIYQSSGGYADTDYSGYYATTESASQLKDYFENVLQDITTKITTEIVLEKDTILRDIMNQGLVLTDGTVVTAYLQEGNLNVDTGKIIWQVDENGQPVLDEKVSLTVGSGKTEAKDPESGVAIYVYNLDAENTTDPTKENYHPHTVDITGYNFSEWFINESNTKGYKMVVTITRVEATDDVQWGRSTATNQPQSGVWLPADANGNRELLLPFDQPTTIFVERAYVLDYGKEFTLSGWYFDDEESKNATPVHLDCNIANGMNWFDPAAPTTANSKNGTYGNTRYGNVKLEDGTVTYTPTSMNWGGYDQFFVFGNTWRKTVLAQDANENGNLWSKVTVIPANNIYYEDSFIATESTTQNGIDGFTFTGEWQVVTGTNPDQNTEIPEHLESAPYGDVHGWTDALGDDNAFTDDSAHATGLNGEAGAKAEFTFTGTGVDVYTRTNLHSGMVVAVLSRITTGEDGTQTTQQVKSIAIDNLAASGDYYHIPTVSFQDLVHGTYHVLLVATSSNAATDTDRYEYYIDGIRVYNPLGSTTNYQHDIVKDAYGLETNAVFTEVRDILLDYGDFNVDLPDSTDGKMGAVFIDWIQPGQEGEGDLPGQELPGVTGQPTYNVGTFETYGPKNEVYLTSGQAIVLKVDDANTYYVGLKSLKGNAVKANVSGIDLAEPTVIEITHSTDMYYRVTPVDGYIVIQNGSTDDSILSITKLRTTNLTAPAANGGVLAVAEQEAVLMMRKFSTYMANRPQTETQPDAPGEEEILPTPQQQADAIRLFANKLFAFVRQWLVTH